MYSSLFSTVTFLHTKRKDRNLGCKRCLWSFWTCAVLSSHSKKFVIKHEYNPLFGLLEQPFAMAISQRHLHHKDVEEIYWTEIPSGRRGMQLRMETDNWDLPVFPPERSMKGVPDFGDKPLKSQTWSRHIERLGAKVGLELLEPSLSQKVFRRGMTDAINSMTPCTSY
jgi:hypothetical protein